MNFPKYDLRIELSILQIITFFYMELPKRFWTPGESHDFWELCYVDKGQYEIVRGAERIVLEQGDLLFYAPDEFHAGRAVNDTAPTLIIISFVCDSAAMRFFEGKTFRPDEDEKVLLSRLVDEGREAFDPPVDSPRMHRPSQRAAAAFGSEQMIKNHLEILLVQLIRKGEIRKVQTKPETIVAANYNHALVEQMIAYMNNRVGESLTIEQICSAFGTGRTRLMTLFKTATGLGTIAYFNKLKIERSKSLIRQHAYNMTELSERLGFTSVHHFSRSFKKETGMTPTEYARSVKARALRKATDAYPE
ncbi:helix-turn-helix domain-containing protein [Paenibacillus hemerocallicola]|uniref:Helix-turn-helix domain-containing protein n=1 Tax=Paenibacillus hemerocallicola TaxID=1172614 RepID=A0A5C4TAA7_9BACL|nr:AraC family transcriptional regulator [Paenibacillus hemerocallicola]TNJ65835.1 helix-turn-helix domain-containing protein [Paenibacillus hemerocallicola]